MDSRWGLGPSPSETRLHPQQWFFFFVEDRVCRIQLKLQVNVTQQNWKYPLFCQRNSTYECCGPHNAYHSHMCQTIYQFLFGPDIRKFCAALKGYHFALFHLLMTRLMPHVGYTLSFFSSWDLLETHDNKHGYREETNCKIGFKTTKIKPGPGPKFY